MTLCLLNVLCIAQTSEASSRYFYSGDGTLHIRSGKSGAKFSGPYRDAQGNYIKPALDKINRAYGAPAGSMSGRRRRTRVKSCTCALAAVIPRVN